MVQQTMVKVIAKRNDPKYAPAWLNIFSYIHTWSVFPLPRRMVYKVINKISLKRYIINGFLPTILKKLVHCLFFLNSITYMKAARIIQSKPTVNNTKLLVQSFLLIGKERSQRYPTKASPNPIRSNFAIPSYDAPFFWIYKRKRQRIWQKKGSHCHKDLSIRNNK